MNLAGYPIIKRHFSKINSPWGGTLPILVAGVVVTWLGGEAIAAEPTSADPGRRGVMVEQPVGTAGLAEKGAGMPPLDLRTVAPPGEYHLPPLPPGNSARLGSQEKIAVTAVRVTGSTVFSEQELAEVTASTVGREVTLNELFELRDRITRLYIARGHINSGATLPAQEVSMGEIEIRVVEGTLAGIVVTGNAYLAEGWVRSRLEEGLSSPLNAHQLEERFQLLRQNDMIRSIQAELRPGVQPGEALLDLHVEEANPFRVGVAYHNGISPNLGHQKFDLELLDRSVLGWNDILSARYGMADGQDDYDLSYTVPLNAHDTTLSLSTGQTVSTVMLEPFKALDIASRARQYGITLRHPFVHTPRDEIAGSLGFQRRESQISLGGQPFFLTPGGENGTNVVQTINLGQEWVRREPAQVLAFSSVFSKGMGWGDATVNTGVDQPDGRFLAWRGQGQWVRQLTTLESQLQWRIGLRLTDSPMLATEKFAIGGMDTVRGYREGLLARDSGLVTNLDWRIPLPWRLPLPGLGRSESDGGFSTVLFTDFGQSWDRGTPPLTAKGISSSGVGLIWSINPSSQAMIYLAKPWRTTPVPEEQRELADRGIHFRCNLATY